MVIVYQVQTSTDVLILAEQSTSYEKVRQRRVACSQYVPWRKIMHSNNRQWLR